MKTNHWATATLMMAVLATAACESADGGPEASTATPEQCSPVQGASTACYYPNGQRTLYEPSSVASSSCEPTQECGFGTMCFQDPTLNGGEAQCHRSLDPSQADKPYYDFGCASFSLWMRHPTKLEIDCRCRTTGDGQGGAGGKGSAFADPNHIDITTGARPGGPIINCASQNRMELNAWPVKYGEGPSFNAWFQVNSSGASWYSGVVDPKTREMFGIVRWTDPQHIKAGTIVAWELDTGNRRVVSGIHPELGEVGSGHLTPIPQGPFAFGPQPLTGANTLRFGPDGMLYSYGGGTGEGGSDQREIVRVDPNTGERTQVWLAQDNINEEDISATFGQCYRPDAYGKLQSVALQAQAFDVGPDGTFYVSMHGIREGDGILAISADGKTCTPLSRWGGNGHNPGGGEQPVPPLEPIGTGPFLQFPVEGLLYHEGLIYGVSNDEMYSFDPKTGNITHVSYTTSNYQGMGIANMFWDPTREVIWAVGNHAPYIGSIVDIKTGRRESVYGDTGRTEHGAAAILVSAYPDARSVSSPSTVLTNGNSIGNGAFVLDPDDNDIVYAVLKSGGLMKLELSTFNNYVMSF